MKKHRSKIFIILLLLLTLIAVDIISIRVPNIGNSSNYFCNVKVLTLRTDIDIKKEKETVANIHGKAIRFVTDPLTMYNRVGDKISYGDDTYHFIAQDSHMIVTNDKVSVEMVGKFSFFGDYYDIYDSTGKLIATAKFNMLNTYGYIKGLDGTLWADYYSHLLRLDYNVRIKDECKIDENTVLMMMASFYSDRSADNSQSK